MGRVAFGGKEGFEDAGKDFGRDAAAGVGEFKGDVAAWGKFGSAFAHFLLQIDVLGTNGDGALARDGLEAVVDDFGESLLEFGFVVANRVEVGFEA